MTIIDLIRQEMIKVRGQIAGIAKLLVDEDETIYCMFIILLDIWLLFYLINTVCISDTARQFFRVIAEKGNTLYNVLSDIISTLSNPEDLVPENDFQSIMKYYIYL